MGDTSIQWSEKVWNPVTGCTKVSPGCAHCYAETVADRFWPTQYPPVVVGPNLPDGDPTAWRPREFTDVRCHEDRLDAPLRWRKPRRVFVNSMSDLFHEDVPDAFIDRVFAVMALTPQHTYQILTKRAERMLDYLSAHDVGFRWLMECAQWGGMQADKWAYQEADAVRWARAGLDNVWLGVSVENQHFAEERIPLLLQTPAAVRFVSAEPLLGPMDLCNLDTAPELHLNALSGVEVMGEEPAQGPRLNWVIVGGESGPQARPCNVAWIRSIVAQCKAASVPVFVKQLGANPWVKTTHHYGPGVDAHPYNVRYQLKDRKGGDPSEWPDDLRVLEFPVGREGTK